MADILAYLDPAPPKFPGHLLMLYSYMGSICDISLVEYPALVLALEGGKVKFLKC